MSERETKGSSRDASAPKTEIPPQNNYAKKPTSPVGRDKDKFEWPGGTGISCW